VGPFRRQDPHREPLSLRDNVGIRPRREARIGVAELLADDAHGDLTTDEPRSPLARSFVGQHRDRAVTLVPRAVRVDVLVPLVQLRPDVAHVPSMRRPLLRPDCNRTDVLCGPRMQASRTHAPKRNEAGRNARPCRTVRAATTVWSEPRRR
jgi:hypothetical protein